jgi:hypothetical protein
MKVEIRRIFFSGSLATAVAFISCLAAVSAFGNFTGGEEGIENTREKKGIIIIFFVRLG